MTQKTKGEPMMIDEFDYFAYQHPRSATAKTATRDTVRLSQPTRKHSDRHPDPSDEVTVIEYERMDTQTVRRSRLFAKLTALFAATSIALFAAFLALVCTAQAIGWVVTGFVLLAASLGAMFYCLLTYYATTDYYTRVESTDGEVIKPSEASQDYFD